MWAALAGVVLQFVALGSNFYEYEGEARDAWFGIPHTSQLILASALFTVALLVFALLDRSPLRGRIAGVTIAVLGALATAQLVYRMIAPPFDFTLSSNEILRLTGSCLTYCSPSEAANADLLAGIWVALAGCTLVTLGGLLHAFSRPAAETRANFWVAARQEGMNPWLGFAALGAVGQFVFGYTVFTFYTTQSERGSIRWSGWLPTPHTSVLVLWVTILTVILVVAAARLRSPLNSGALGVALAVLGLVSSSRIFFRVIEPPFGQGPAEIGIGGYLALASALLLLVAGLVQAATHREPAEEGAEAGHRMRADAAPGQV